MVDCTQLIIVVGVQQMVCPYRRYETVLDIPGSTIRWMPILMGRDLGRHILGSTSVKLHDKIRHIGWNWITLKGRHILVTFYTVNVRSNILCRIQTEKWPPHLHVRMVWRVVSVCHHRLLGTEFHRHGEGIRFALRGQGNYALAHGTWKHDALSICVM
jgi:hypothetical protein